MDEVGELIIWAWDEYDRGNTMKIERILGVCRRMHFRARIFHNLPLMR